MTWPVVTKTRSPLGSACGDEVIADLVAIEIYLPGAGTDIRFPVDH